MIRRYERARPGELMHIDVETLRRIPGGGGRRALGRAACPDRRRTTGYDYIHSAVDDHTRIAYSEIHPDEKAATCAAFLRRAAAPHNVLHTYDHHCHTALGGRPPSAASTTLRVDTARSIPC